MPRRKPVSNDQLLNNEPPLMLPAPRPAHKHGHDRDPYETPPGAVPAKVSNLKTQTGPIKRQQTKADELARQEAKSELRIRASRYRSYLDEMIANGGDQLAALAVVYGLDIDEVKARRDELHADVRSGIGGTELAEVLEQHDLGLNTRVALLKKHAFSDIPAASLKAVDMINDLEGDSGSVGTFESYLRLVKAQKG